MGMKTMRRKMLAAILTICGVNLLLTSCADVIDNPSVPKNPQEEMTEEELGEALVGMHVDVSSYMMGDDLIRVWDLRGDKTFIAYDLYYNEEEDDAFAIDTLKGTWKPFLQQEIQYNPEDKDEFSGFYANFDGDPEGFDDSEDDIAYLGFLLEEDDKEDDDLFFLDGFTFLFLSDLDYKELHPEYGEEDNGFTEEDYFVNNEDENPNLDNDHSDDEANGDEAGARKSRTRASARMAVSAVRAQMARTRAAGLGSNTEEVIASVGSGLGNGVTSADMATQKTAQTFFENTLDNLSNQTEEEAFFNPNDASFTRENWRKQQVIYIYDGVGPEMANNYRFSKVALPWAKAVNSSNLPLNFCNDVTPENGWELVMNYCGNTQETNANYMALYNRFTGTLRFFVYVPNTIQTNANDHAWEVTLSEELAQHMALKFGLPIDNRIKNKGVIGMNGTDYSMAVSPWISSKSNEGYSVPASGWWAFDVDMSLYRPDSKVDNELVRLQMLGWEKKELSLTTNMKAELKTKEMPETFSMNSLTGLVGKGKDVYSGITSLIAAIGTGGATAGLSAAVGVASAGIGFIKSAIHAHDLYNQIPPEPYFVTRQYLEGTMTTTGTFQGSAPIRGIPTETFPMSKFETKESTFGQGVWNLKSSPVMYQMDRAWSKGWDSDDESDISIFSEKRGRNEAPIFFLDPSSIEVELNPNVFNKDNVEYVEVNSVCGVRKGTTHTTHAEYRQAFGMQANRVVYNVNPLPSKTLESPAFDYYYNADPTLNEVISDRNLKYPDVWERYETYKESGKLGETLWSLVGRGDDNYMIEPQLFTRNHFNRGPGSDKYVWSSTMYAPCYVVTVIVTVKLKNFNEPFVFTRNYLPENVVLYCDGDANTLRKRVADKLAKDQADPWQKGHTDCLESQLRHLELLLGFVKPNYTNQKDFYLKYVGGTEHKYSHPQNLVDGNYDWSWQATLVTNCKNRDWECRFETSRPINIKSYTLVTDKKTTNKPDTRPYEWALYGRNSDSENWVQLDYRNGKNNLADDLPADDMVAKSYVCAKPGKYQKFMFIVGSYYGATSMWEFWNTQEMRLAELEVSEELPLTFTVEKSSGGEPGGYEAKNLFDMGYKTEWHSTNRVDGKWFVEFKASEPISPKSYRFLSGNDSGEYWDRTPAAWKVYGKQNKGDEWTLLSDLDIDKDKTDAWIPGAVRQKSSILKFNKKAPKNMQYFRLEISRSFGSDAVQLNEMFFNY